MLSILNLEATLKLEVICLVILNEQNKLYRAYAVKQWQTHQVIPNIWTDI
jgi:hypothetical protein